jgi:hypothetical protein
MLENKRDRFVEDFDQEEVRTFLTIHTTGYKRLIERMKKKHNLDPDSEGYSIKADHKLLMLPGIPNNLESDYDLLISRKITFDGKRYEGWLETILLKKDIEQVLESIPIKYDLLLRSLAGYPEKRILGAYGLPIYHASKETPITEEGTYIRVTPLTLKSTLIASYKQVLLEFDRIAEMASEVSYDPNKKPERSRKTSQAVIDQYIEVESLLFDFLQDASLAYHQEETELKLTDALESVAKEKQIKLSSLSSSYHDLKRRFYIPKLKQFEKLVVSES